MTLTAVTTEGKTYSYTTQATLKAGNRYSFTISDMQKAARQQTGEDYSDYEIPARQRPPVGIHARDRTTPA